MDFLGALKKMTVINKNNLQIILLIHYTQNKFFFLSFKNISSMESKRYYDILNFLSSENRNSKQWPNEILLEEDKKKQKDMKSIFRSSLKRRYRRRIFFFQLTKFFFSRTKKKLPYFEKFKIKDNKLFYISWKEVPDISQVPLSEINDNNLDKVTSIFFTKISLNSYSIQIPKIYKEVERTVVRDFELNQYLHYFHNEGSHSGYFIYFILLF